MKGTDCIMKALGQLLKQINRAQIIKLGIFQFN